MDLNYDTLRYLGNGLAVMATLVGAVSVYLHVRVDWWRSQMGRHLMIYMGAIEAVFILSCVRMLIGDSWPFALIRLIVFAAVPLAMAQRVWLQLKAQRGARADVYAADHDRMGQMRDVHTQDDEAGR